jgi:ribosomal protein S18 acetylase RimI-like enzyme
MTVLFFRNDGYAAAALPSLPEGFVFRVWRPEIEGLPLLDGHVRANLAWWAFARLGIFARPGFCELTILRGRRSVHRLIVTPRWYRFPFMAPDDLQIGDLWTDPGFRRLGLARRAMAAALDLAGSQAPAVWYITESGNRASMALARESGMRMAALGERTRPRGIALAGQFRLLRSV